MYLAWAGIEYDGRWKVLHYTAKDIYRNVIITPFHNLTTGDLEVWVTSDLWSTTKGTATIEWYNWAGAKLNVSTPNSIKFDIGAINSTRILQTNTKDILLEYDPRDVVLYLSITANGYLPNNSTLQNFKHKQYLSLVPLSQANLVDPGLEYSYNEAREVWTIEATKGIAAWVWFDYPSGLLGHFEDNGFWLVPGAKNEVGFTMKSGGEDIGWVNGVTVESLWDMTVP
jgi:beta-mannosidase